MLARMSRSRLALLASLSLAACTNPGPSGPAGTYEEVAVVFNAACTFSSCHGGMGGGAGNLNLMMPDGMPFTTRLVDVAACQYDALPLVDPGNPEGSYLWIKLTTPNGADGNITFTPAATWDPGIARGMDGRFPPSTCPLVSRDGEIVFGHRMPDGSTTGLSPARLDIIRAWIENGAPGPS